MAVLCVLQFSLCSKCSCWWYNNSSSRKLCFISTPLLVQEQFWNEHPAFDPIRLVWHFLIIPCPFVWHQHLLCRTRCFHWQLLILLKHSTGYYTSMQTRLHFIPLKAGALAGHPFNLANLNFLVLFRDIYRWEFWQEWVSVFEGILLLIMMSVFSLRVSRRWM